MGLLPPSSASGLAKEESKICDGVNAAAFLDARNAIGPDRTDSLFKDFVSLRRLAAASNTFYSSTLRQLEHNRAFRRVVKKSRSAVTSELRERETARYPINLRRVAQAETQA